MKAGSSARKSLTLSNTGKDPVQVRVYLNDWALEKNAKSFMPAGSTPYSLKNNLKLFPSSFNLNPNESKSVVLSFMSQSNDPDGQYGVVFFEVQPSTKTKNSGVSMGGRLGTLVSKEIEGKQKRQLQVINTSAKLSANQLTVSLSGKNLSALLVRPKVTVVLTNEKNDVLYKGPLPSEWILLPSSEQTYAGVIRLDKINTKTNLTALITIDLGDDDIMLKECKVVFE